MSDNQKHTIKSMVIYAALLLALCWLQGCVTLGDLAGERFNDYQFWYTSLPQTDQHVDMTCYGVTYRLYGNLAEKQARYDEVWGSKHPGRVPAGLCIANGGRAEIWADLREIEHDGKTWLVAPPHIIGHETMHLLHLCDRDMIDPDELVNIGR